MKSDYFLCGSLGGVIFWKIFSLRSKNSILLKRLIHHFVVPFPPPGKADFESANISYRELELKYLC